MFSDDDIHLAARIQRFMMNLHTVDQKRYSEAMRHGIPFGDLAYAQALVHWRKKGKPANAWFSWADSERECALTIAFRKEIGEKFGLRILTKEEAKLERAKHSKIFDHHVKDWGPN